MFSIGSLVSYPAQGVGKVEKIETQIVGGIQVELYIVHILANNVTILVPVGNAEKVGLRPIYNKAQGLKILEYLEDRSDFSGYSGQNWNRRYREYSDKLKSNDLRDVAYVLKELILIGRDKDLSFGERCLLEQAQGLISLELSFALKREQADIKAQIEEMYADVLKERQVQEDDFDEEDKIDQEVSEEE